MTIRIKEEDEISKEEIIETIKTTKEEIIKRLKNPLFWIDNALIIALIITVIILATQGYYTKTNIIEVCNGIPIIK